MPSISISDAQNNVARYAEGNYPECHSLIIIFRPTVGYFSNRFPNVEEVTVYGCGITDLSFLSELDTCKRLRLLSGDDWEEYDTSPGNNIADYSVLTRLESLETIEVSQRKVIGHTFARTNFFKVLKHLPLLNFLYVHHCDVDSEACLDLSVLTNLLDLNLTNNKIRDIEWVSGMTKLVSLDVSSNKIVDIGPVKNCVSLKIFEAADNRVFDIDQQTLDFLKRVRTASHYDQNFPVHRNYIHWKIHSYKSPGISRSDKTICSVIVENENQYITSIEITEKSCSKHSLYFRPFNGRTPSNPYELAKLRQLQREIVRSIMSVPHTLSKEDKVTIKLGNFCIVFNFPYLDPDGDESHPKTIEGTIKSKCEHGYSVSQLRNPREIITNLYYHARRVHFLDIIHTITAIRMFATSTFAIIPNEILFRILSHLIPIDLTKLQPFSSFVNVY
jgi:Leucine-rich repeat (LRR) protein